jgi:hypothetical protein
MNDLLTAAVAPVNIIPTILLVFILMYWLTVIVGLIDLDALDIDLDVEGGELEVEAGGHGSVEWLNSVLLFFNIGQVPFMVFLTFLVIPLWVISVMGNYYLGNTSFLLGLILLIPNLVVSLFIAKFLTAPLVKVFGALDKESKEKVEGKICTLLTGASAQKVGQARIDTGGSPLLLNVMTYEGISMDGGETGMVIERDPQKNIYFIEPFIK